MSFHDVQFPTNISYGSQGGPGYKTQIVQTDSGYEQRIIRWSQPRHKYDVSYGVRSYEDIADLKTFYMARMGAAYTFRFKDWTDFTTTETGIDANMGGSATSWDDQLIATQDGSGETEFQLVKRYTSGSETRVRNITKPIAGTIRVGWGGVEKTSGWALNTTTGVLTIDPAPSNGDDIVWGGQFDVHCRFGESADELLNISVDDFGSGSIPSIEIVEVLDNDFLSDEFYYGGSAYLELTGDISITESMGRVLRIEPGTAHRNIYLPAVSLTSQPGGGPMFYIFNESTSAKSLIVRGGGSTVVTIDEGDANTIVLGIDASSSNYQWLAL